MPAQVDLPRLKDGRVGGAFWSAFVLCPKNGTDFSDANYAEGQSSKCYVCCLLIFCVRALLSPRKVKTYGKNNAYSKVQPYPRHSPSWTLFDA